MKTIVHVKAKLIWRWSRTKHGNYIAVCDPIAQTVEAGKFSELLETIHEALESTFRELFSSGDLENFLKERGWAIDQPVPRTRRNVCFEIPFDLKEGVQSRDLKEAFC